MDKGEKLSDFIEKHTVVNEKGIKQVNAIQAIAELYVRIKTVQNQVTEMQEGLGDYANFLETMDKRVNTLEGKKQIISLSDLK